MAEMAVEYITDHNADRMAVNAARVSHGNYVEGPLSEKDRKLIKFLIRNGHFSPFCHSHFELIISGMEYEHAARFLRGNMKGFSFEPILDHEPEEWRIKSSLWGFLKLLDCFKGENQRKLHEALMFHAPITTTAFTNTIAFETANPDPLPDGLEFKDFIVSREHLTFYLKAPIMVARQVFRHSGGFNFNELSRRYVTRQETEFLDVKWRTAPDENIKQGSGREITDPHIQKDIKYIYKPLLDGTARDYQRLLGMGVAPEQARGVLPQTLMTEWYQTGHLKDWARFLDIRLDTQTVQSETVQLAKMIERYSPEWIRSRAQYSPLEWSLNI
jgi:flavin-dependent thymidylate synthase